MTGSVTRGYPLTNFKSYATVINARNEEKFLPLTIDSIQKQTINSEVIIVMNDGSSDMTGKIARNLGCFVIDLLDRGYSAVGRPELAKVINTGFQAVEKIPFNIKYVLTVNADHPLPKNYVELLIEEMEKEPNLVVSSGFIEDEPYHPEMPRDSGRIYLWSFLKEIGFLPVKFGWGAYPCFKALQLGYKSKCFNHISSKKLRPTSKSREKHYLYGKAMRSLGYSLCYAIGRCFINKSWGMLKGYFSDVELYEEDLREFVKNWQKQKFKARVKQIIKRFGRK